MWTSVSELWKWNGNLFAGTWSRGAVICGDWLPLSLSLSLFLSHSLFLFSLSLSPLCWRSRSGLVVFFYFFFFFGVPLSAVSLHPDKWITSPQAWSLRANSSGRCRRFRKAARAALLLICPPVRLCFATKLGHSQMGKNKVIQKTKMMYRQTGTACHTTPSPIRLTLPR